MIQSFLFPRCSQTGHVHWTRLVGRLLFSVIAWVGFADISHAMTPKSTNATLIVRSLEDGEVTPAPPTCEATCTLRDAIRVANATEGPDIIEFAPGLSGEIVLLTVLTITDDLILRGPGQENLSISVPGNDFFNRRAFISGATVEIRDVTVQRTGTGRGGGIANTGDLTIANSTIRDSNYNGPGGALLTTGDGTLSVINSNLLNNRSMRGSGIYQVGGTVQVIDTIFRDNRSTGAVNEGSAIRNEGGALTIRGSSIFTSVNGDAIANIDGGITTIANSLFQGNGSGAIYNEGADSLLEVSESEFISNTQAILNGTPLVELPGGVITVTRSIFTDNKSSNGGAILNQGGGHITLIESVMTGNRATFSGGGAIDNAGATMTILNSTLQNNIVSELANEGGAIRNSRGGVVRIENSTFSGNLADEVNDVVVTNYGACGAISNNGTGSQADAPATLLIINSTFSGNRALREGSAICSQTFSGAGTVSTTIIHSTITLHRVVEPRHGGALYLYDSDIRLEGVILAGNTQGEDNVAVNLAHHPTNPGTVTSLGYNLSDTAMEGFGGNDLAAIPAHLGPLANNGGPTRTHALLTGSLAIDARPSAGCPATDQRGIIRPFDGDDDGSAACDIGAFEIDTLLAPPPIDQQIHLPQITNR